MELKRYTIGTLILMIAVGMIVFSIEKGSTSFDIFGIHFPNLPIAFWVVVPLAIMYLASVLHMGVYALSSNLALRRIKKDHDKLVSAIRDGFLGIDDRNYTYKSEPYKLIGKLVDNSMLLPFDTLKEVGEERIDDALSLMRDIKENKKVDIKKFNLPMSSSIVIQNNLNKLERGELSGESILSKSDSYGDIVSTKAYEIFVKNATYSQIIKYQRYMSLASLVTILERVNSSSNGLDLSNDEIVSLFATLKLNRSEWIDVAKAMAKNMLPEQRIRVFEMLSEHSDDAMYGYLFTLYDLQMIDSANEILNNTSYADYQIFKAYRDLKNANKHYDIALFVH